MSTFDTCMIDLGKRGFSRDAAIRACTIAAYRKTGMMPDNPELKKSKEKVSKDAVRIAGQLSQAPRQLARLDSAQKPVRLVVDDAFSFKYAAGDSSALNPMKPLFISERGYSPRLLREVFLIRTGTFNEITFTEDDLQSLVDEWDRPVPFQIDHSTAWRDNCGSLLAVRKSGKRVYGLAEFVGYGTVSAVQAGDAKEVSIGFWIKPRKLIEVSFTKFPAVGGKDPAQVLNPTYVPSPQTEDDEDLFFSQQHPVEYSLPVEVWSASQEQTAGLDFPASQPQQVDTISTQIGGSTPQEGQTMALGLNISGQGQQPPLTQNVGVQPPQGQPQGQLQQTQTQQAPTMGLSEATILAQMQAQLAAVQQQMQTMQTENQALKESNGEMNRVMKLQRNTQFVVGFAQQGLSLTANSQAELDFIGGLSDDQLQKYIQLKQANGPVIPVGGRVSTPEVDPSGSGQSLTAAQREEKKARLAADYSKQNGNQQPNSMSGSTQNGVGAAGQFSLNGFGQQQFGNGGR